MFGRVGHLSQYLPARCRSRLPRGTYPVTPLTVLPLRHIRSDRGGSSLMITFLPQRRPHALTQLYGRNAIMLPESYSHVAQRAQSGPAAHHTADGTVRDEVNSEHVPSKQPRPAGCCRGRPSCSNERGGGLLDAARRQLSPDASRREISVDTCRRVLLCLLTCCKLLLRVGGGPPQMLLAQGQQAR